MLPEIEAREILENYNGHNNQILLWKNKQSKTKNFVLTRQQANYIISYKNVIPRIAKKDVFISPYYGEKIEKEFELDEIPKTVWCEKLLCETDEAYNFWGGLNSNDKFYSFWLPKISIIPSEKKLNRQIDYTKYKKRPPFEHQKLAIEKLLANDRFILADSMGCMKTSSTIIASLESGARKILVVCPASLKINWEREIKMYTDKKILIVEGKKWGSTFDYYIINYDIIKNFHTMDKNENSDDYKLLVNANFDLAIVDEAHFLSNPQASRTQLLNDVLEKIPKVWLLTGTPLTSRPINFFNLLKIIKSPLALNWQSYVKRYCKGYQFTVKNRKIWNTSGASNLDELREITKNQILRRLTTEILDLPEKIVTPIYLELDSKMYDEEFDEFIKISKESKKDENISITITRLMKVRQLIAIEKIKYTCELIDKCIEEGNKVVILTNFTAVVDAIHEQYKKNSVKLDGRMNKIKKQESVDKFQNDEKIKIFVGNIKAAGVGITLTAGNITIMNDLSFVPAEHAQGEDRTWRYGQKNNVIIYYPIFENTIEMIIYNILNKKKNIIDQVMGDGEYSESFSKELLEQIF
jgi:SWI/SNF-related matrix-associated actin-dependent regulator 1 of chromatin subfamily A